MLRPFAPLMLAMVAAGAGAQLLPRERTALDEVLLVAGLRRDELKLAGGPGASPLETALRTTPIDGLEGLMEFAGELSASPSATLDLLRTKALGDPAGSSLSPLPVTLPESVPAALRVPVARLVGAVAAANAEIRASVARLSPEEKRRLIEELPTWVGRRAGVRPAFSKAPAAGPDLFPLLARVDLARIRRAGAALDAAIDGELPALRAATAVNRGLPALRFVAAEVVVVIGSNEDDVHDAKDAGLLIDLGGNDRYTGRAGAGIGYASALIDLGPGGARFELPDAGAGCGLVGVGVARIEGEATGTSELLAFGAGVAGVGLFTSGRADLESRGMAQGFGLAGIGVLRTGAGRDGLRLGTLGQGCGFAGGVGILLDAGGDDRYECRGLAPDELASAKESCAQGYGEGGIGMLLDAAGSDLYELGARGQGAAEGGLGLLHDADGNDLRHAARFAQGYAVGGTGVLADLAGDDLNATRGGEAHGSAGAAGFGVHFDRAGDDAVLGGAAGIAGEGGFGLFLDAAGEDELAVRTRPEQAGGIGLFLALGAGARGLDLPSVGTMRAGPDTAVAAAPGNGPVPNGLEPVAPGSLPANPERIARAVGLLVSRRGGLRSGAVRELTAFGRPGLDAAVERLEDLDDGGIDALAELVVALGELGRRALAPRLTNPTPNALRLAGRARVLIETPVLLAALEDPLRRDAALEAIAGSGEAAIAPAVLPLVVSEEPGVPRLAMRALLRVGGAAEEASVRSLITTPDRTLRLMVHSFLARFPGTFAFARDLSQTPDPVRAAAGISILALIGSDEALRIAGTGLNSPSRDVRLAALRALNGRVPEGWRARILELQADSDPLVSATARGVEFGR